jgi:DNA-binding response OmpR family regulator
MDEKVKPRPARVLVVDDDRSMRCLLSRVLESANCEVITAGDGAEAQQAYASCPYDLVFLDLHLPDAHGLEVLARLRAQNDQVPIVLMTAGKPDGETWEKVRRGESLDCLRKPFEASEILRLLREACRGN